MERAVWARWKWSRPSDNAQALPDELLSDIFHRLPAKAIVRCGAVCTNWRGLTSSAEFLFEHYKRQPSLPLAFFHGPLSSCSRDVADAAIDAFDLRGSPATRQPVLRFNDYNLRRQFSVHASCAGLILLSASNGLFYICNPATRQSTTLPMLNGSFVAGMYPYSSSPTPDNDCEYFIRILYKRWSHQDRSFAYYVLTLGSWDEPRCLGPVDSLFVRSSMSYINTSPPVLLRRCLHWDESRKNDGLMVFDTVAESFRSIKAPTTAGDVASSAHAHLFEMDGMLGMSLVNKTEPTVDIWVLQDYEMELWSLRYKIKLPVGEMRCIDQKCSFRVLAVSGNGNVVVLCETDRRMFHCDSNGRLLERWDRDPPLVLAGNWFKESLRRHAFFPRQRGGRVKQQPRFFRGL